MINCNLNDAYERELWLVIQLTLLRTERMRRYYRCHN